ncbi:hypothetical protein [Paenibacillus physcomitrellae]|uniref:Copper amine oxidase-like N-terminal domain-containing protein n=1 Tax=Paenibacillus physcomitrellae TaxID=1619311 RepID=A0ABQ1GMM8_9BACL|nr:hypothetical protein [Paenibacillus physcomitrellae]GGA46828.1 hypothetical protein GCM10010917_35110 [Paenibacillus physcomitrellae]
MKLSKIKVIVTFICVFLLGVGVASAATNSILKIGLDGFTLDMTKSKGKVQVGNKMVPATIAQNGTTYIAAPAIGTVFQANYAFDSKTGTFMFKSHKEDEDKAQIKELQGQVSTLKQLLAQTQSNKDKAEGWLEYRSKHFTLLYTKQFEKDVEKAAADFEQGYNVATTEFASLLPGVGNILNDDLHPIYIYLHPSASDNVDEGNAYNKTFGTGEVLKTEIHVLTPSAYQKKGYTLEGGLYDEDYFTHLFKHEFIHTPQTIIQEKYREKKTGWFTGGENMQWIKEGQAEYLAAKGTDDLKKSEAYWKPIILKNPEEHITIFKDNVSVKTQYIGGYMFTAFLYETYGNAKFNSFLSSSMPTLEKAFVETFGSFEQVNKKWMDWLKE